MDWHIDVGEIVMGQLVNRIHTPVSFKAWHDAHEVSGFDLSIESRAILCAQGCQEHGLVGGLAFQWVFGWNMGNRRAYGAHDWCLLPGAWECAEPDKVPRGAEILGYRPGCGAGKVAYLLPAKAQRFAAFPDIETGLRTHLEFLRAQMPLAFCALEDEDARAYVSELKKRNYFSGDEAAYFAGVRDNLDRYPAWLSGQPVRLSDLAPGPHTKPVEWGCVDAATVIAGIFPPTDEGAP